MASFNASATSSSSKPTRGCTFEVFLSFRGEDTRYNFVDHLYAALVHKGINVFKDDEMIRKGKFISQELTHAIEESRFSVVVLSKNYADSSWYLGELVKIMKCRDQMGLMVLPVFYHVDPSDVRKQKGDYATAFQKHEKNINSEKNEVNEWREALGGAASLSGYHISAVSGGESLVISKIVQEIMGSMQPRGREDNLIGIEFHMDVLNRLLSIQKTEETSSPPEEYKELSLRAIRYTGRLPLALKVIGCFFHGRKAGVWESALDRLTKIPDNEVFEILKISFDGLHYYEKKILLDIACFFKDSEVKYATRKLDSFDFNPEIGISVLVEKSLIIVSKGEIHMHDLIHEMCLQIVHESIPNSRLRNREEVHGLVEKKEIMPNLKFIHLDILYSLSRFPDVSEAPNIERLILSKCHKMVEVHESVGFFKKLVYMEIFLCEKLKRLPSRIEIESLDTLKLNECPSLKGIP
ncbi:hypothetical protein R6Q59_006282 [Mikania micrantha]